MEKSEDNKKGADSQSPDSKSRLMKRPRAGDGLAEVADENEPEEKRPTFRLQPPTLIHGKAKPKPADEEPVGPADSSASKCKFLQPPKLSAPSSSVSVPEASFNAGPSSSGTPAFVSSSNPFLRMTAKTEETSEAEPQPTKEEQSVDSSASPAEKQSQTSVNGSDVTSSSFPDSTTDSNTQKNNSADVERENLFLTSSSSSSSIDPVPEGFLFGRKMEDRVTGNSDSKSPDHKSGDTGNVSSSSAFVFGQNFAERAKVSPKNSQNETSLFMSRAAEADSSTSSNTADLSSEAKQPIGLEESAAAHFAASQNRTLMPEVECITGEEDEKNVLQLQCKLHQFEPVSQNWLERGVGILHLNDGKCSDDDIHFQSRLVMRTHGSLRLVLNTKIWAQMTVDKASKKSVRVSAQTDDGKIGVFLITATINDAEQIHRALEYRILHQKQLEERRKDLKEENPNSDDNNQVLGKESSTDEPSETIRNDLEKSDSAGSPCPKSGPSDECDPNKSIAATPCGNTSVEVTSEPANGRKTAVSS